MFYVVDPCIDVSHSIHSYHCSEVYEDVAHWLRQISEVICQKHLPTLQQLDISLCHCLQELTKLIAVFRSNGF